MNKHLTVFVCASKTILVTSVLWRFCGFLGLMKILWFPLLFMFSPNKLKASLWIRCCVAVFSNPLPFSWILLTSFSKETFKLLSVTDIAVRIVHLGLLNSTLQYQKCLLYRTSRINPLIMALLKKNFIVINACFLSSLKCTLEYSCVYLSNWSQMT